LRLLTCGTVVRLNSPQDRASSDHSAFRSSGCGSSNLRARGMEDRARVIDGANVGVGRQALEDPRAKLGDEEDRQRPLTAGQGRDGGHRRKGRSGISRAQGARAGLRPIAWHFFRGCGDGSREVKKLEMSHFTVPWRPGAHVVTSASGPGSRRHDNAARQDRKKQSEPETSQKFASQKSHSTPHAGRAVCHTKHLAD
jgi:hypothetical protein